jgi:hypothetical protein
MKNVHEKTAAETETEMEMQLQMEMETMRGAPYYSKIIKENASMQRANELTSMLQMEMETQMEMQIGCCLHLPRSSDWKNGKQRRQWSRQASTTLAPKMLQRCKFVQEVERRI